MTNRQKTFLYGVFASSFGAICIGVLSYLSRRLMANNLPENEYAFFYSLYSGIVLALCLIQCGIPNAMFYLLPDLRNKQRNAEAYDVYSWSVRYILLGGVFLTLLGIPIIFMLQNFIKSYGLVLSTASWFLLLPLPLSMYGAGVLILNSMKSFIAANIIVMLNSIFTLTLLLIFLPRYGLPLACGAYATGASIIAIGAIFWARWKHGYLLFRKVETPIWKTIVPMMSFVFISVLTYESVTDLGTVILSMVSTSDEVAILNIALPIALIARIMRSITGTFIPFSNELFSKAGVNSLKRAVNSYILITLGMLAVTYFIFSLAGCEIISLLFNPRFAHAADCTLILCSGVIIWNFSSFLSDLFNAIRHEKISAVFSAGVIVLSAVSYWYCGRHWGADGIAWTVVLVCSIWGIAEYLIFNKIINKLNAER